jgi:hypothetical protein
MSLLLEASEGPFVAPFRFQGLYNTAYGAVQHIWCDAASVNRFETNEAVLSGVCWTPGGGKAINKTLIPLIKGLFWPKLDSIYAGTPLSVH